MNCNAVLVMQANKAKDSTSKLRRKERNLRAAKKKKNRLKMRGGDAYVAKSQHAGLILKFFKISNYSREANL